MPAILIWLFDVFEMHKVIEVPRYLMGTHACHIIYSWLFSLQNGE